MTRLVAVTLCVLAAPLHADELRGRVWSGDEPAARAVVLLDGAAAPAVTAAKLDTVWLSFVPKVQVVAPGARLVIEDTGDESHTVHAWLGGETLFNQATVPHGVAQAVRLTQPGVVSLTCDIHREMRAFVVVSAAAQSAVADLEGRFTVAVAPGHYAIRVWRPDADEPVMAEPGRAAGSVDVGPDGAPALELRLPPRPPRPPPGASAIEQPRRRGEVRHDNELPRWLRVWRDLPIWPSGPWVLVVSAFALVLGVAGAAGVQAGARRRGWSKLSALLIGCALAFFGGALVLVGAHVAVATALGFGAFIGTAIYGAAE